MREDPHATRYHRVIVTPPTDPLPFVRLPPERMRAQAEAFHAQMRTRRSVRHFSSDPVPRDIVETAIATAATAPSGAHLQPWTFVLVGDPALKQRIREAAEAEERESYEHRMSDEWLAALAPLGTDWNKPHITNAPWLIVVFEQSWGVRGTPSSPRRVKHYYVSESVGISVGFLIAALHGAGLATLPHTPSPMKFLRELCGRPENERPMALLPVGYPAPDARVPRLERKPLDEVLVRLG
jgi:nitroreductase